MCGSNTQIIPFYWGNKRVEGKAGSCPQWLTVLVHQYAWLATQTLWASSVAADRKQCLISTPLLIAITPSSVSSGEIHWLMFAQCSEDLKGREWSWVLTSMTSNHCIGSEHGIAMKRYEGTNWMLLSCPAIQQRWCSPGEEKGISAAVGQCRLHRRWSTVEGEGFNWIMPTHAI